MDISLPLFYLHESFLGYLQFEKRYSKHTIISYKNDLSDFIQFLVKNYTINSPKEIDIQHIRTWLVELKSKKAEATTIRRKISTLKTYFKYLQRAEEIVNNPMTKVSIPKIPKKLPEYLKENETDKIFNELQFEDNFEGHQDKLIMEMLYGLGLRRSELASLKENDIDFSLYQVRIFGKGGKERLIPISKGLGSAIQEFVFEKSNQNFNSVESKEFLFVTTKGKKIYVEMIYRISQKYLSMVTTLKKKSPHVLRHTFATHLSNAGADMKAIKDLMGHASLASTQVYTHNSIEKLKKVYTEFHPRNKKK